MKTFARIATGAVAEIITTDRNIATLFHPGLEWVDVTGKPVAVGDIVSGSGFAPPTPPATPAMLTMAQLQAEIVRLAAQIDKLAR
jgi:hypothetical protein